MTKNKKTIGILAASLSAVLVSSITLLVTNLIVNNVESSTDYKRPLNRGKNYEHYEIKKWLLDDKNLPSIIDGKFEDNLYVKVINEIKLRKFLKNDFREILRKISKFATNADDYKITYNYQLIDNNKGVYLDIVWNLTNSNYYFYDQVKLLIT